MSEDEDKKLITCFDILKNRREGSRNGRFIRFSITREIFFGTNRGNDFGKLLVKYWQKGNHCKPVEKSRRKWYSRYNYPIP
jgi:hypothetical protein